jgi:DnaJ homolog subfamily A member 2
METGDVVIILQQKSHELFQRQGDDLYLTHTVTMDEALRGFSHVLKVLVCFTHRLFCSTFILFLFFCPQHLDGRDLEIRHPPVNIFELGSTKMVPGEGMPRYRSPLEKGELYIKLDVSFPLSTNVGLEPMNQISPHWLVRALTRFWYNWTSSVEFFRMFYLIVSEIVRGEKTDVLTDSARPLQTGQFQ